MYLFYSALLSVLFVLATPWWLAKKRRVGLWERLGRVPDRIRRPDANPTIWIHSVSVGEVLAVSRLIAELKARFPDKRVVVSTTTATGQKLARDKFGENDVFYFPVDFAFAVRPYLRELKPEIIVLAETEFWPRFLHEARRSGAKIAVVNGRISDRSFPRYQFFARWMERNVLCNVDLFLAQSEQDETRLKAIGAAPEDVHTAGNLKFDVPAPAEKQIVQEVRKNVSLSSATPVIVAGSTLEGEEEILLQALKRLLVKHPLAVLFLAPRHPERFDQVSEVVRRAGVTFWRRSQWKGEPLRGCVFLLD